MRNWRSINDLQLLCHAVGMDVELILSFLFVRNPFSFSTSGYSSSIRMPPSKLATITTQLSPIIPCEDLVAIKTRTHDQSVNGHKAEAIGRIEMLLIRRKLIVY
ncbi:hypothetical protein NPIL_548891 [Nephila pilipes]|uniref:Uncharacterized protein n=1 Tax=Nephila pilipes TaxID=299642 RepID=A0A8X6UU75_NEPPI|nr:hypothetical protein NPIL_548891 [Nephila pilipes]